MQRKELYVEYEQCLSLPYIFVVQITVPKHQAKWKRYGYDCVLTNEAGAQSSNLSLMLNFPCTEKK